MSGGARFKFQGSNIQFMTGYSTSSPSGVIASVTKANPAVVTQTAHGLTDGDVIRILGAVGMTELNSGVFVIQKVTTNSYKLLDVDSTDYGTYTSGGRVDEALFSRLCELTSYQRSGGSSQEIAATSQCSTAQEFEIGLPDFGTTQVGYNFAPQVAVQASIEAFYRSGAVMAARATLPNSGGVMVQLGFVQQTSEGAQVGGLWTGNMTLRNTGVRHDFAV